jgi:hypothetical protein
VRDARAHLGALDVYHRAFDENTRAVVPSLKKLGAHITEAKVSARHLSLTVDAGRAAGEKLLWFHML